MSHNRSNIKSKTILFIGGGNMATAIITGLVRSEIKPFNIYVVDHNEEKLQHLKDNFNVNILNSISQIKTNPDIIILAVKPFAIKQACKEIKAITHPNTLIISIAAGVTLDKLINYLPNTKNIIRAMPNTPAAIQKGITILYLSPTLNANPQQSESKVIIDIIDIVDIVDNLFNTIGQTLWVNTEDEINTTMAISGCGPAYIFLLCESLMAAGNNLGIEPHISKKLITATIEGACQLYASSDKSAAILRKEVTSPNGTTEQAINTLNPDNTKQMYINALEAAVKKLNL